MSNTVSPTIRWFADKIGCLSGGALIYALLGAAGLLLAIPPGYASPIFPAAGFAVAMLLWREGKGWLAVFLGSLLLNVGLGVIKGTPVLAGLPIALCIAFGASIQAVFAAQLVRRVAGRRWRVLEDGREITRVLLLAGPLASLIAASVGVFSLFVAGVVSRGELSFAWWTWWLGDTIGVLVALPLCIGVRYYRDSLWQARIRTIALPMLVTLGAVAGVFVAASNWERAQLQMRIRDQGEQIARVLERRYLAHRESLAALRRLIEVMPDMSYNQFDYFTRITLADNPDIFALSVNPYVQAGERVAFERHMARLTNTPGYVIRERNPERQLVTAAQRSHHVVVGYIAPLAGNRPALGFDINSEPVRRAAIEHAIASHQPALSAPIRLVQENRERVGALLLLPAYRTSESSTASNGAGALIGFAVGVLKLDELVQIATASLRLDGLDFQIEDASAGSPALVYRSHAVSFTGDDRREVWTREMTFADRVWTLRVRPTSEFLEQHRPWTAWAVGVAGLLLSVLLQTLLLVTSGRATILGRSIEAQSDRLEDQDAALRDRTAQLDTLFELSPDGFVAFARDGSVRLTNPAFHDMTGISLAEVVGRPVSALEEALRQRMDNAESFSGIDVLFRSGQTLANKCTVQLTQPRQAVLQIMGIRTAAASIERFVYFRDITHEAEVDRIKSEFLSHAAHELRTPMASIYGFTELLLKINLDDSTRRDLLETIHRQTSWMVDIINELLDLARIEARRGRDFKLADVDMAALAREAVADLAIDRTRWPITIELPETPTIVRADPAKLRQALGNVLSNAKKYSPEGGEIVLRLVERPGMLGLSVSDHGIGMTPAQALRVGERFWRADTSGKTPGTGLGMAIVKEILHLHGGELAVASVAGEGTTMTLWVPVISPLVVSGLEELNRDSALPHHPD